MHALDIAVVLAYLALTVGLGIWFGRNQSRKEFFAAGGAMSWLPVGLSVMATLFSSNSFAFYPAAAYQGTLLIGMTLVAVSLMTPVIVWIFIPVFTRLECSTAYEYLEKRFHVSVRCLASGLFIFLRIGWIASATFAASVVLARVAGVDQIWVILALGAVAIGYTMLGGLRAVMWTDVIQFFIFAGVIGAAIVLIAMQSENGVAGLVRTYFDGREGIFVNFNISMTLEHATWILLIGFFLEAVSAYGADQVAVQRYLSAKNERTAKIGAWVNLGGMWLVIPGLLAIGVGLYGHFQAHPEELLPVLAESGLQPGASAEAVRAVVLKQRKFDEAMPQFVSLHFPPGMLGLFFAAVMAAIMSSIDSGIHSVTTAIVVDFRDRLWPHLKPADEKRDVFFIRALLVIVGSIAMAIACWVALFGANDIFTIGRKLTSAFGGPLLAVFILAFFFKRAGNIAVFSGACAGAVITLILIMTFPNWYVMWWWPIGTGLALFIAIPLSFLERPRREEPLTWMRIVRENRQQ